MKEITDGVLFDTADRVLNMNGYRLQSIQWDDDASGMAIYYDYTGVDMKLHVYGLPEDIPTNVFKGFIEHFVKTKIRGQKNAAIDKNVAEWLKEIRAARLYG